MTPPKVRKLAKDTKSGDILFSRGTGARIGMLSKDTVFVGWSGAVCLVTFVNEGQTYTERYTVTHEFLVQEWDPRAQPTVVS